MSNLSCLSGLGDPLPVQERRRTNPNQHVGHHPHFSSWLAANDPPNENLAADGSSVPRQTSKCNVQHYVMYECDWDPPPQHHTTDVSGCERGHVGIITGTIGTCGVARQCDNCIIKPDHQKNHGHWRRRRRCVYQSPSSWQHCRGWSSHPTGSYSLASIQRKENAPPLATAGPTSAHYYRIAHQLRASRTHDQTAGPRYVNILNQGIFIPIVRGTGCVGRVWGVPCDNVSCVLCSSECTLE